MAGGFTRGGAFRRGDVVVKPRDANALFRHQLLDHLEAVGFEGAPRSRGYDEKEERFTFLEGHVAWSKKGEPEPDGVYGMESVLEAMHLIRRFHDAAAGHPIAAGCETVLHGDLGSQNTVYRRTGPCGLYRPFGFIDFMLARPGDRMDDLAYAIHQYLALGYPENHKYEDVHPSCIRQCWDAYGLDDPTGLIDRMIALLRLTQTAGRGADVVPLMRPRPNWLRSHSIVAACSLNGLELTRQSTRHLPRRGPIFRRTRIHQIPGLPRN